MDTQHQQPAANDKPVEKFHVGPVHVSIWRNDSAHGPYFTATFERRYKDASDQWKSSRSFGRRHQALLSLSKAADKAEDAIVELETQLQIAEQDAQHAGPAA